MKQITFVVFALLFTPFYAFATVRVNEIAWMGTSVSSSNEWIELYNDGDTPASLSGFTLFAEGVGKLSVPLSGSIAPKGFFLLERTNDDTVPGIIADKIYTGILGNSGETLILKDASGTEIQKINGSAGWPAGDNATKETMQWGGNSWGTATATPRMENVVGQTALKVVPGENGTSPSEQSTSSSGNHSSSEVSGETSAHLSPLPLSDFSAEQEFFISAGRDRSVPAGGTLPFDAYILDTKGKKVSGASFTWTFGDGTAVNGSKVSHTYEYPGNYIVILNAVYQDSQAVARARVRAFAPEMSISFRKENEISLVNHSSYDMNVSRWMLRAGSQSYIFPEDTIVGAKEEILVSSGVTKFQGGISDSVSLVSQNNKVVAESPVYVKEKSAAGVNPGSDGALQNIKIALDRVASGTESVRRQLSTTTTLDAPVEVVVPQKPKRNVASYQYASAVDIMKISKKEASSSDEKQVIVLKKPEGFFVKLQRLFLDFF